MTAKPKILVVDDDRSICKLMGCILEMESYPFRVAMTAEQARRAMEEERFDILVSDIYLGDDSGLHLLERMKCVNSDAEVVIMTAHGSMETAVHAVHNGAFDYISKPFVVDEMLRILPPSKRNSNRPERRPLDPGWTGIIQKTKRTAEPPKWAAL